MSKPFYFGMSVDDVALKGWCKPENFAHLIEFFKAEQELSKRIYQRQVRIERHSVRGCLQRV